MFRMKRFIQLFAISLLLVASCSKDETPPAPTMYTLSVSAGTGGAVSTQGGSYESGSKVSITATPNAEYVFSGWSNGSTENPLTITITGSQSLQANFTKRKYALNITIEGEGTVTEEIISAGKEYDSGTVVKLTAVPSEGWVFSGWSGDVSETDLQIQITVSELKNVNALFTFRNIFSYRVPNYNEINLMSGTVLNNKYSPNSTLSAEFLAKNVELYDGCDCVGCGCETRYIVIENSYRIFDYNNDNKPDFFGFLVNVGNNSTFSEGKYVFIKDIFNNPQKTYINAGRHFDGRSILGDYDNDGYFEILIYSSEDHDNNEGSPVNEKIPLSIIDFDLNGEISIIPIGPATSNHDLTVLDIDNDGDLDIVNFEWYLTQESYYSKEIPLFYINEGNYNFTFRTDLFKISEEFNNNENLDFIRTATDSFDLNNDGFLDLIIGNYYPEKINYNDGVQVVWGNESGVFDYMSATQINIELEDGASSKEMLGFNFIDYNNDGWYDIFISGDSNAYNMGFIDMYKNNGDKTFTRVTKDVFDSYYWTSRRSGGQIPIIYEFQVYDVDNDGLFDLRPANVIRGDFVSSTDRKAMGPNLYWKNNGGKFIIQEDFYFIDSETINDIYNITW